MADNQEKSDDLIAELAKLMASNAQGSESETKPSVIKLPPLSEAPAQGPVRIPGMDSPRPAAPSTTPPAAPPAAPSATPSAASPAGAPTGPVRIPGMTPPPAAPQPKPVQAEQRSAPSAMRAPGQPAPGVAPQSSGFSTKPAELPARPEATKETPPPKSAADAAAVFSRPLPSNAGAGAGSFRPVPGMKPEPKVEPDLPPPPAPSTPKADAAPPAPPPAAASEPDDSFDFDFGFGSEPPAPQAEPQAQSDDRPQPGPQAEDMPQDGDSTGDDEDSDPIAALINAEADAPQPSPAKPQPVFPASIEAVPGSSFGRNPVAGPVLIGHPRSSAPQPTAERQEPQADAPEKKAASSGDSFAVAPVFGLGGPQPRRQDSADDAGNDAGGDPMAEIESLIGEAVRVQISESEQRQPPPQRQPQQQPPPVVPPLTTGFAPRRAGLRDVEPRTQSAEAAILAAAAATGAKVGRVEAVPLAEERPYRRNKVKPPNIRSAGGIRQYLGMAVAVVLLLAAGFGLYWVLGMGGGDPENAPVLTADTSPVKEPPAAPAAETAEVPRSVVFDEMDGGVERDTAETLVSRDETEGEPVTEVARVAEPEVTENGLANRRVRTVTVRPDGTIVSADDAVAGSEPLPVERPNVPDLPGEAAPSPLLTATTDAAADTPAATGSSTAADAADVPEDPIAALMAGTEAATAGDTEATTTEPVTELSALTREPDAPVVFDGSLQAPVPMPRPADRSRLAGAGSAASAPANPASANPPASIPLVSLTNEAPASAASTPAGGAEAYVQLASLPSEGEARSQVSAMQSRWGSLFGGQSLVVQRAELDGGRVTYRLRLPTSSLQDATRICASIKANGGDCFATNG